MKRLMISILLSLSLAGLCLAKPTVPANGNDFEAVVKVIEQHYHVKHKGIPFLARAGIKTATTAARLAGGRKRQIAEAGSAKVAYFENQDFTSPGGVAEFRRALKATLLPDWLPFVQVLSPNDDSQTYVFLREVRTKFNLLVVTIERHEGTVVQVDVSPQTLALLMQDPNEIGKAVTDEATTTDY